MFIVMLFLCRLSFLQASMWATQRKRRHKEKDIWDFAILNCSAAESVVKIDFICSFLGDNWRRCKNKIEEKPFNTEKERNWLKEENNEDNAWASAVHGWSTRLVWAKCYSNMAALILLQSILEIFQSRSNFQADQLSDWTMASAKPTKSSTNEARTATTCSMFLRKGNLKKKRKTKPIDEDYWLNDTAVAFVPLCAHGLWLTLKIYQQEYNRKGLKSRTHTVQAGSQTQINISIHPMEKLCERSAELNSLGTLLDISNPDRHQNMWPCSRLKCWINAW